MTDQLPILYDHSGRKQMVDGLINHYGLEAAMLRVAKYAGYVALPPDIETFMDSPDFCGDFLGGKKTYPTWRACLQQVFPNAISSPYMEIAITGCIGGGKTHFALIGMLYDLCKILHMAKPHQAFGLSPVSQIIIALITATMSHAESTVYRDLQTWLYASPFFLKQMSQVGRLDKRQRKDLLPHRINILGGSRARHVLSRNVAMACLDELNFQSEVVKNQAAQNYAQLKNRLESRFGISQITPGRLWLASSKTDESGYLEQYLKVLTESNRRELEQGKEPSSLIICKSIWAVKEEAFPHAFDKRRFKVFIGDERREAFIPSGPGEWLGIPEDLLIDVPENYRGYFERNLIGSLRDFAGVSTWGSFRFMSQESLVRKAICIENPVYDNKQVVSLDFADDHDQLINHIDIEKLKDHLRKFPGSKELLPCYIHYDIGVVRDRTGIAISTLLGEVQVERPDPLMQNHMTRDLITKTVLALGVQAKPGSEVPLSKLRNFFIHLIERGIPIAGVSCDQYQSTELLQLAKKAGLAAELISVDRTREPYEYLRDSVLECRWTGPIHDILLRELLNLRDEGKKIDHPVSDGSVMLEQPSKDLSDAVAGSVYMCKMFSGLVKGATAYQKFTDHMDQARKEANERQQLQEQIIAAQARNKWFGGGSGRGL